MELSKERLEKIAELARKANYKPCAMHMTNLIATCDSEVIEEMARRLLAAEEQQPYGYVHKEIYELEGSCGLSSDHEAHRDSGTHIPLYLHPQQGKAVQVPPEMTNDMALQIFAGLPVTAVDVWNACRAAMLTSEPVSNRDELPDFREKSNSSTNNFRENAETSTTPDLVMIVKVLCRSLRHLDPDSQKAKDALAYLKDKGLISTSDILRTSDKDPE